MTAPRLPLLPTSLPAPIEIVAFGEGVAVGQTGGRYLLVKLTKDVPTRPLTPLVSLDEIDEIAESVLFGEERYVTWNHVTAVLALGTVIRALEFGEAEGKG